MNYFTVTLVLFTVFALFFFNDPKLTVEGAAAQDYPWHALEIFLEPNEDGNVTCPVNSSYPILSFCSQKIPNLDNFIPDPFTAADIGSHKSMGIWALYTSPNYNESSLIISLEIIAPGFNLCMVYGGEDPSWMNPRSIRHLGNPNPGQPGLSLFPNDFVTGPETYVDDSIPNFEEGPIQVGYWVLTGHQNWTLYSQQNFEGESVCLDYLEFINDWAFGSGQFHFGDGTQLVGSIQRGCHSKVILTTDLNNFDISHDDADDHAPNGGMTRLSTSRKMDQNNYEDFGNYEGDEEFFGFEESKKIFYSRDNYGMASKSFEACESFV